MTVYALEMWFHETWLESSDTVRIPVAICTTADEAKAIAEFYGGGLAWDGSEGVDGEAFESFCDYILRTTWDEIKVVGWLVTPYALNDVITSGWFDYKVPPSKVKEDTKDDARPEPVASGMPVPAYVEDPDQEYQFP